MRKRVVRARTIGDAGAACGDAIHVGFADVVAVCDEGARSEKPRPRDEFYRRAIACRDAIVPDVDWDVDGITVDLTVQLGC